MTKQELHKIITNAAKTQQKVLDLRDQKIEELPAEIGQLTNLTTLNLSKNKLTSLPTEIGQLKNLTELTLDYNKLSSLPNEIGQLKNLTELNLSSNQLASLPTEIGQLTNLRILSIFANKLTYLPVEIGLLKNLLSLILFDNQLISLPDEIRMLDKLVSFLIDQNLIKKWPEEIEGLRNIEMIGIDAIFVANLVEKQEMFPKLSTLFLDSQGLTFLPVEIYELKNLMKLYFYNNKLTKLPAEIVQLTKLTTLDLHDNQLNSLPAEIGQLKNLNEISLSGNPLTSLPPEVVKQGTKAVLEYLRELDKGAKKLFEAKLLILGDGGEGKTCVSRALRGLPFKEQIRTPGVEVTQWIFENLKFRGDKSKEIKLNIWDFEGQEINHQSHQFFLTEQSLYLLVINGRRPFKKERAEYWLDTIRARAPGSRVILVASECEITTPSWPLDKLKANYGDLLKGDRWFFEVGCENSKRVDDLAAEIKTAAAEMLGDGINWPVTYTNAEKAIKGRCEKKETQVKRTDLYEIFRISGISKGGYEGAAAQMHSLGLITQFKDSPALEDFVVLNPQWLTKGISKVMEDGKLKDDKGEITRKRMKEIWDDGYNGLYPVLHNCMKEFELCYDMEDKEGCLIPLRFGSVVPQIPWSDIPGAKERRIEYRLNIRPPYGIMSRFIVKTHHMIVKTTDMPKGVYWHNGVFLGIGEGEYRSEALCEFDQEEKALRIRVRAAFPQNMIEQLHGFVKAVFGFFEGLEPERRYGCVKFEEEEKEQECEGAHPEMRILFALSRNSEIDCEKGWHTVDPKRLVYGFSSFGKEPLTVEKLREELRPLVEDMKSSLIWIDKTYSEAIAIREQGKKLPARIAQEVQMKLRDYLGLFNELLDNRDFNPAPAIVAIRPVDGSAFNPKNWFEKKYELVPYCECEQEVHPVNFSVKFEKPKIWWVKAAPWLSGGIKVFSAGVKIACAGLPMVTPKLFEAMKNEAEFMKELADELESDAELDMPWKMNNVYAHKEFIKNYIQLHRNDEKLIGQFALGDDAKLDRSYILHNVNVRSYINDFLQLGGKDEKRIVRLQLAKLLEDIAPNEYKARQWGELRRVRMPDNTYRWLCPKHAKEHS